MSISSIYIYAGYLSALAVSAFSAPYYHVGIFFYEFLYVHVVKSWINNQ